MSTAENPRAVSGDNSDSVAGDQLRSYLERYERMSDEIAALTGDRSEILKEAKANGLDTKTIRKLIALRKKDPAKRQEEQAILETYAAAIGMDIFS